MYDPFHSEYLGHNPIHDRSRDRAALAAELWRLRCVNNASGRPFDAGVLLDVARSNLRQRGYRLRDTSKLDARGARDLARDLWDTAEGGIPRGLPCGADDACGERLDHMRSKALAIWRAVGRF